MDETTIDTLNGQLSAISPTMSAIIGNLPSAIAAQTAQQLQDLLEDAAQQADTPPRLAVVRDAIGSAYLGLLRAVARNG
jgi:hypothetical protein